MLPSTIRTFQTTTELYTENIFFVCVEVLRPCQPIGGGGGGHVERVQLTLPHFYWAGLVLPETDN